MGQLNANTIKYNAHVQAVNDLNQASTFGAQSQLYTSQAGWDMANSILGGASTVGNKWLQWQLMSGGGSGMLNGGGGAYGFSSANT